MPLPTVPILGHIVNETASLVLGAWLRDQRLARGWSKAEMSRQLHRAAKAKDDYTVPSTAILASYVRRWETNQHDLTERYRLLYCTALGITPSQFGPSQPPGPEPTSPAAIASGGRVTACLPVPYAEMGLEALGGHANVGGYRGLKGGHKGTERTEQPALAALPLDQLTAAIADESLDFGEWVGMSEVADATIEQYANQAQRLSRDFEQEPPFPLLLETRRLRDRVASQLRAHQRLDQARDLYLISAQVCGLLAWMTGDLGSYRSADTHAWTAWMCAEQAGHDGARTWVRATQAKLAYWGGRYSESAQLAEDGLRYQCTDTARAFLALFQARALAKAGRREEARQALARAEAERERAAGPDLIGGVWGLTAGRFHGLAASARMLLDDPSRALTDASQAVALSESAPAAERHIYSETLARIDLAEAHLREPDLDATHDALRPVLGLHPDSRIDPVTQRLMRLEPALAAPGLADSRQAQELQGEIETFCGEAIPSQIST
jgi:transcriptional regulator with XRE-family HTH domain/tetratricopeptide (TPR) repeat protein